MRKNIWSWVLLVAGGHFWVDFYANMLPPLLPFIALMWGLNNAQLALLVSLQSMTSHFLQPIFGYFMDKSPLKWSLGLGIIVLAIPMSLVGMAGSYLSFLVMVVLAGIGTAMFHPLGASRVVYGIEHDRALKMSIFSCFGSIGYALAPVITAYIVSMYGLGALVYALIPAVVWVVLIRFLETRNVREYQVKPAGKWEKIPLETIKPLLTLCSIVALRTWVTSAVTIFIPLWLVSQGLSEKSAGLNLTLFLAAGTIGGLVCGYIYPKTGTKKMLVTSFILTIVLLPLYFYVGDTLRIGVLIILGFVIIGTAPVTIVIGQEILPRRAGLASGVTMGLAFGLGGLGIMLTGFLADKWGTVSALLLTMIVVVPAIILTIGLDKMSAAGVEEREEPE